MNADSACDLDLVAVRQDCTNFRGIGLQDNRGQQCVAVRRILERLVEHRVLLRLIIRQADIRLRAAITVTPVVLDHAAADGCVRGVLIRALDGRPHGEAFRVGLLAVRVEDDLPRHLGDELGVQRLHFTHALLDDQWRILCFPELVVADEPQVMHPSQHIQLARLRPARIVDRVVRGRRLRQARKHGGLGDGDVLQRLAEIDLRRGGEAVRALAQEDLVDVELEDLVLGQRGLDLPGEQRLAHLPGDRLFPGQEEVPRHLHRDRSRPLLGAGRQVRECRAQHAQIVHAAVRIETLVFGGQNGLFHDIRDIADGDDRAPLLAEFAEQIAFRRDDTERNLGLIVGQRLERRQCRPQERQYKCAEQGSNEAEAQNDRKNIE
jgi:hypothetical protein